MISVDPSERPTFDSLLHTSRGTVFPESFYSFLHNYVSSLNEFSAETLAPTTSTPQTTTPIQPSMSTLSPPSTIRTTHPTNNSTTIGGTVNDGDSLPSDSDHRLERIWLDYESIEPYIAPEQQPHSSSDVDVKVEFTPHLNPTAKPFQVFLSCFSITFPFCSRPFFPRRMFYQSNYIFQTANLACAHQYMDVDLLPQKVRNPPDLVVFILFFGLTPGFFRRTCTYHTRTRHSQHSQLQPSKFESAHDGCIPCTSMSFDG